MVQQFRRQFGLILALFLCGATGHAATADSVLASGQHAQRISRLRGGILGLKRRRARRAQEQKESDELAEALGALGDGDDDDSDGSAALDFSEPAPQSATTPEGPAGAGSPPSLVAAMLGAAVQQQQQRNAAAASEAARAEPATEDEADSALGSALARLRASASSAFPLALETLSLIISNILDAPDEPKFRRLRLNNALIKARVRSLDGGADCLKALGFRQEGDVGDAAAYVLDKDKVDVAALAAARARFDALRRRALDADREAKAAVAGLLSGAPAPVRAALEADAELKASANAMLAHPLFANLMADGAFRQRVQAGVQDEATLRALIHHFSTGRVERVPTREAWFDLLLDNKHVVALFSAKWCGPCQLLKPIVAHLSQVPKYNAFKFVLVDGDELPQVAQEAMVGAYPTIKLFVDCREQDSIVGLDMHKLLATLDNAAGGSGR